MSARTGKTASKDKLRLWRKLLRTTHQIEMELRERLRRHFDTTMPRFDVMAALARTEAGLTMTALSRQLLVSNGNVTGIIERLAADGLVARAAGKKDRRSTVVRLTAKGKTDFAAIAAAHEAWVAEILARFDGADARALIALLAKAAPKVPDDTPGEGLQP